MNSSYRTIQILRGVLLASILVYILLAEKFGSAPHPVNPIIFFAVTINVAAMVLIAFFMRRSLLMKAERMLNTQPEDKASLERWRQGHLILYVMAESVALCGLMLRFLGFSLSQVAPFYLAGLLLIIFFAPRRIESQPGPTMS